MTLRLRSALSLAAICFASIAFAQNGASVNQQSTVQQSNNDQEVEVVVRVKGVKAQHAQAAPAVQHLDASGPVEEKTLVQDSPMSNDVQIAPTTDDGSTMSGATSEEIPEQGAPPIPPGEVSPTEYPPYNGPAAVESTPQEQAAPAVAAETQTAPNDFANDESVAAPAAATSSARSPSPRLINPNRQNYFQVGAGPAYGIGWASDSLMYNIIGSYNSNINEQVVAKGFFDLSIGTGTVGSRLTIFGAGAEYYIPQVNIADGDFYVGGDVGLGFGRNARENTGTGIAVGAATGFKFRANDLNWDINAHYALLTADVGNTNPSVVSLRAALNF